MNQLLRYGLLSILVFLGGCSEFENLSYDLQRKPAGKFAILIDLPDQHAYLSKGGGVLLTAPVSTGREGYDTPAGHYTVIEKDIDHRSSIYGAYVQDGTIVRENVDVRKDPRPPNSTFIGASMPYFLRIIGGVGLHAGYLPGYPASHGCIRMPESKAKRFFEAARVGTPVTILR
jgi:lipoprotein-anchoring transpeptidase ErfK/SrfK